MRSRQAPLQHSEAPANKVCQSLPLPFSVLFQTCIPCMEGGNGLQHFPSLTFTPPESGKRLVASPSGRRVWFADEVPEGLFPEGLPLACDAPPQHPPSPPYEGPARPLKPAIVVRPLLPPPRRSWYQRFRDAAYADHTHELHALCYAIHDPRAARAHKLVPYLVRAS